MRWLRVWWRSLRRRYPGKPNGRALDPAFQRAARIHYELGSALDHTPNAVTVAAMREAERRT
jgi:hypothetical protein